MCFIDNSVSMESSGPNSVAVNGDLTELSFREFDVILGWIGCLDTKW